MGDAVLRWRGREITARAQSLARQGLWDAAEHLRGVSQDAAPIDEGTLRATAAVTRLQGGDTVAVSYDTPYARRQHEELGYRHPKGGRAKYLEDPAREEETTMRRIVETTIKRGSQ